ncbi:MAG: hypothetical protein IPG61_08470 [bacterium]|nr:hypothetical protein [bacterium]
MLTIYLVVVVAAFPIIALSIMAGVDNVEDPAGLLTPANWAYQLSFSVAIAAAAAGAWRGHSFARHALVVLAVIHYGSIGINNLGLIADSTGEAAIMSRDTARWGRVVQGVISIAILVWYFYRDRNVREYYKRAPDDGGSG